MKEPYNSNKSCSSPGRSKKTETTPERVETPNRKVFTFSIKNKQTLSKETSTIQELMNRETVE